MTTLKMRGAFWTGSTGRQIRALPNHKDVRILASYLVTNPAANLYGLYPLNLDVVSIESGLTPAEVADAFRALAELDFAHYDPSGWVWVVEMAAQQLNTPLKPGDYMQRNAVRWYAGLPNNPFLRPFWTRYQEDLWTDDDIRPAPRDYVQKRGSGLMPLQSPSNGAPMPRSGSDQDQKISEDLFGEKRAPVRVKSSSGRAVDAELVEWFNGTFWPAYPRKTDRKDAIRAVEKLKPDAALRARIIDAIEEQKRTIWLQAELEKIPHASTWLNKERWTDVVRDERPRLSKKTAGIARSVEDFVRGGQP